MRTKHGRKRAKLHPAQVQILVGVAGVTAAVGVRIRNGVVAATKHVRYRFGKGKVVAADVPRPLDGITVACAVANAAVTSVYDVVNVGHDVGTAVNDIVFSLLLPRVLCNFAENVHAPRFRRNAFRRRHKFGVPVAVVPPGVKSVFQVLGKAHCTVGNFIGVDATCAAVLRFRVVVKHYINAVVVCKAVVAVHVGEQICVHVVANAAVACHAPVGVDNDVVQWHVVCFVVKYHLLGLPLVVLVVATVPIAEGCKTYQFRTPCQFHIQFAKFCGVFATDKQVHVLRLFVNYKAVVFLRIRGIAAFGQNHTRIVGNGKHVGRFVKRGKFAAVTQIFVYVCNFSVQNEFCTAKIFGFGGYKERNVAVGYVCAVGLFVDGDFNAVKSRFVCDKHCVAVAKNAFFACFQTNDIFA